jgi:hypothetical protein
LSEDKIKDRVKNTVEEYLQNRDAAETTLSMKELPVTAVGFMILTVIEKYLDNKRPDHQSDLLQLLNALSSILQG